MIRLPLATLTDLQDELAWVGEQLDRMDAQEPVNVERWENRRLSLIDHRDDVLARIAELERA